MKRTKRNKAIAALLFLVLFSLFVALLLPVHGESEIYDAVIRFHVIANSDEEDDQALKRKVRDALLEEAKDALAGLSRAEAEDYLRAHLDALEKRAQEVVQSEGYDYAVSACLAVEDYPEKNYDALAFPAGSYLSLQVKIGEAAGKNWWCCLFPPLCLGVASVSKEKAEDAFLSVGLTPNQYKILTESETPTYKVRFKLLELIKGRR